jgi:hypothetical protein
MCATDLEIPEPPPQTAEAAIGLIVELGSQVAGLTQREMNAFVEILAGLTVSADDLIGDEGLQQSPDLVLKGLVVSGQFDAGEVHSLSVTVSD